MDNVGLGGTEHLARIGEAPIDMEALRQLSCHEQLPVANGDKLATGKPANGLDVEIGDLAASDDGNAQHGQRGVCSNCAR